MASEVYSRTGGRVAPQSGKADTFWWRYMRLSGILLVPLAFIHLGYMHIINSVAVINYHWVIETRWAYLGWRVYDAALLWFAGLHGFRGLQYVINDYVHDPKLNRALIIAAIVLMVVVLAAGSIALVGAPFAALDSVPRP